ncbi:hypothetical protein ONE63_008955 [Megalurothrips usitatus]|uniref:BTB domain-containing protein n=1 Tax=Megalurothrips usitatus TaxID=439358 RepID=A0AAV7XM72_9NEOP|nr:hypothetical protein ONE63_008955 [Megalurothrips usitatus]
MSWPVMNLRRKVYSASQLYHVDRWCLICGQEVRHHFKAPSDSNTDLEWELIISVSESKWNEDNDPRMDISLKPKWANKQTTTKRKIYAEVTFTVDEHRKESATAKRYASLKFNMARISDGGYTDVLRSGVNGMGMPIKASLAKVVISIQLVYVDGPLEVITVNEPKFNPEDIPQKLGALLDSGKLCDVVFDVGGKEINAHRAILSAMSQTFAAMFEHDLSEKRTGRVVITDCEPDVFQTMIRYLYTGGEPAWKNRDTDFMLQLLLVADKYGLTDLRTMCLSRLLRCLTPDNAVPTFLAFQTLGLKTGEDLVFSYLRENSRSVLASDAWGAFLERDPRKAADLLVRVVSLSDAVPITLPSCLPSTPTQESAKRPRND